MRFHALIAPDLILSLSKDEATISAL